MASRDWPEVYIRSSDSRDISWVPMGTPDERFRFISWLYLNMLWETDRAAAVRHVIAMEEPWRSEFTVLVEDWAVMDGVRHAAPPHDPHA